MKKPAKYIEVKRIEELESYNILDSDPDPVLDSITSLISVLCDTPISLITLVDKNRQWFISKVGTEVDETPRDIAFCHYAIQQEGIMEVEDTQMDVRFKNNPLVTGDPKIRFYAGVPLINDDGYALGTLCLIDNKPKKLSEAQRKIMNVLGKFVITHLDKKLQEKKVTKTMKIKDELLSMVSKEMQEPMSNIKMMLEFMERKSEVSKEELEILKSSSIQLNTAVSELLNFKNKREEKKYIAPSLEYSLTELANELRVRVTEKHNVPMSVSNDSMLPDTLYGDPLGLRMALDKLIEFSIETLEAQKLMLYTEIVEDDGVFMKVAIGLKITHNRDLNVLGSNFKLMMSSELLASMGSNLRYIQNGDYKFVFDLKFKKSGHDNVVANDLQKLSGLRVLIVDDIIMNRFVAGKFITKWGMSYNEAADGEEAIDMFLHHQYDIILMDLEMPNVNGFEAIKKIRAMEKSGKGRVPIIAVSNASNKHDIDTIKKVGANDLLMKPFNPNELIKIFEKYFN